MGRFLSGLFGGKQKSAPAAALRVQTSLQGVPIPILLGGQARLASSLIWYGAFTYSSAKQQGGKGGSTGGGGKGQSGSYIYSASFLSGLCEGPIGAVLRVYLNGNPDTLANQDLTAFLGDYAQIPWGYLSASFPSQALNYRGVALIGGQNYGLGSSPSLPNFNFEVLSDNANAIPGQPDADPSVCGLRLLTNGFYGVGFPAARIGDFTQWSAYARALGLLVSPVLPSAVAAAQAFTDLLVATNCNVRWSSGLLTVVPYGDTAIVAGSVSSITENHAVPIPTAPPGQTVPQPTITVGNVGSFVSDGGVKYHGSGTPLAVVASNPALGQYSVFAGVYTFNTADESANVDITYSFSAVASFTPNVAPIYDFTLDQFMPNQGSIGQGMGGANSPLIVVRKPRDKMLNNVKVEYLDRNNNYNPVQIEAKDEASIIAFSRERPSDVKQMHLFCLASAAQQSAALMLRREVIPRTFQWTVGRSFILCDGMDIVTVTDAGQNIFRQPVRIEEIQENSDRSLTMTAEEFLGTASAPLYGAQAPSGYQLNYNQAPGPVNPPIIFEPTDELGNVLAAGGGLMIAGAVSGLNPALWGGCHVWACYQQNGTYEKVGTINGPARMGLTTADFPPVTPNPTGPTVDITNTLSVDLSQSAGSLLSASQQDADSLNTPCYVGGEIIAYRTAALTGANKYNLTYLPRGAFGTNIVDHPSGSPFARLDQNIFTIPFDQGRIGSIIYLKFTSFNQWQGGEEDLSGVAVYPYTIQGTALASPLPAVTNYRVSYVDGNLTQAWDEISDFRPIVYEIRKGNSWESGNVIVANQAHPPFASFGDGTYYIKAKSQPVAGLTVYSQNAVSITIANGVLVSNIIGTWDEFALGWPGTFSGPAGIDPPFIRTGGAGNILTDPDILNTPDILNYAPGGGGVDGYYIIPTGHVPDALYARPIRVGITWKGTGVPVGQNILSITDFLNEPDILGGASTQFTDVFPEISISQDGTTFGPWQKYVPGEYVGRKINKRLHLNTVDPKTIAYALSFSFLDSVADRIDHYTNMAVAPAGTTVQFTPDGLGSPVSFIGGPSLAVLPNITAVILNAQAGDLLVVSAVSLSQATFQVLNGGVGVARNVNLQIKGF